MVKAWQQDKKQAPWGIYCGHLSPKEIEDLFPADLVRLNLTEEETKIYQTLFSIDKIIIYNSSVFSSNKFETTIPHEREHKFIDFDTSEEE